MDKIIQAVERVKARQGGLAEARIVNFGGHGGLRATGRMPSGGPESQAMPPHDSTFYDLEGTHLENQRIIGHDSNDPRSKAFDMLRTPVLQTMDQQNWQFLAVTAPTQGCGATLSAINLALSIGRHAERAVLLVDLNLQRPGIAKRLGLPMNAGLAGVLNGHVNLTDAVIHVRTGDVRLSVLPTETPMAASSEWIASRAMMSVMQAIRRYYGSHLVIFDLPPVLAGDEAIAFLPQVDCALLVAAVGLSTIQQVEECQRHLHATKIIRTVVNKVR